MPVDRLAALSRDLAALPGADRRAILAGLDRADRDRLRAATRSHRRAPAPRSVELGEHSAWFDALMAAARQGEDRMTAAARAALLGAQGAERAGLAPRVPGRTLLQAAGGLFVAGKSR